MQPGKVIAHRGLFTGRETNPNSVELITESLRLGLGVETDLRDRAGSIVVSHDPVTELAWPIEPEVLRWQSCGILHDQLLALNVKADGLLSLTDLTIAPWLDNAFFFDMSFPQWLAYAKSGLPVAQRVSEFERFDLELAEMQGPHPWVWLDAFESDWWLRLDTDLGLPDTARVVLVSPELHGRDPRRVWDRFVALQEARGNVWMCTDYASRFFSGEW